MEKKLILLVEDNPDDVALIMRSLEKGNIANEVVVVGDGEEALEYLLGADGAGKSGPSGLPVLVLLDLKLPKIDGLEVLKRLRQEERTRLLPVVVFTSSKEEGDLITSYSLGANSFVRKPVDFGDFAGAVAHLGLYWLLLNEPPPLTGGS